MVRSESHRVKPFLFAVTQKAEAEAVVIRRYGNRRLYDTRSSSYVNLADVEALLREGKKIREEDATTDEDVTRRVLTQIVLESADEKGLPLDLLYELARASDRAFRDFLDWYLKSSIEVYHRLQERWQADARRRWGDARPTFEAWAQLWDPRQVAASLVQLLSPFDRRAPEKAPVSGDAGESVEQARPESEEIADLRRRLDQLERRLGAAGDAGEGKGRRRS
jgi:polyhydroxyalkanoate synthesis repressor PhaR